MNHFYNEKRCSLEMKVKGCGCFAVITIIIVIRQECLLSLVHKAINLSLLSNKQLSPTCTDRLIESMTILLLEQAMLDKVVYFDMRMHQ